MAGKNSLFRIMKDQSANLIGLVGLSVGVDAVGSKIAALVTAFKDSSGNAAVPQLDVNGAIPVSFDAGTCVRGDNASQTGTAVLADLAAGAITLTASTTYKDIEINISSMTESCFQLIWDNNGVETILAEYQVGPGQYSYCCKHNCMMFTSGATGTQELKLKGANASTDEAADLKGQINVKQPA